MTYKPPLILASKSFGRRNMLQQSRLDFESIPAQIDERSIETKLENINATHEEIALELAKEKALAISAQHKESLIIGSDQILECEGQALHKAKDKEEAIEKLSWLSGKTHCLISTVCLAQNNEILWSHCDRAYLTMHNLDQDFIQNYAEKAGAPLTTCVGAYALEELGSWLFEKIEGDHYTIMGMPLLPLLTELRTNYGITPTEIRYE